MANIKSAAKKARQAIVRRDRNHQTKKTVRTTEKKIRSAITAGTKKEELTNLLQKYSSLISKAAQKGVYHKNTAARKISRLATLISK